MVMAVAVLLGTAACGDQEEFFRPDVPEIPAIPLGLDPYLIVVPDDNPIEPEKVALGWQLFYDARLSGNEDLHCASCHLPPDAPPDLLLHVLPAGAITYVIVFQRI